MTASRMTLPSTLPDHLRLPADSAAAPPIPADLDEETCVVTHVLHRP